MSNISVALTSSKYILAADTPEFKEKLMEKNIPICHAIMGVGLFGFGTAQEAEESHIAEICKDMARTVAISKPNVFIGMDPKDETSALIEYREERPTPRTESFFDQWEKQKTLFMEFQAVDLKGSTLFALRGLWIINRWYNLDVYSKNALTVFSTNDLKQ